MKYKNTSNTNIFAIVDGITTLIAPGGEVNPSSSLNVPGLSLVKPATPKKKEKKKKKAKTSYKAPITNDESGNTKDSLE